MKLSKENKAKQRAIRKAIVGGKSVGGLLAGALVLATAGCDALLPGGRTAGLQPRNPEEVSDSSKKPLPTEKANAETSSVLTVQTPGKPLPSKVDRPSPPIPSQKPKE